MQRKIITIVGIVLVFMISCIALFDLNNKDNNLKKIRVADAPLFYCPLFFLLESQLSYF